MKLSILLPLLIIISACASITLEPTDFAWPIESVLEIDENGSVNEPRYSLTTNVKELFIAEKNDSSNFRKESVRIIRDTYGYYYFISGGFKNVYVFNANNGKLSLYNKIEVSEFGLDLPAFNQRSPFIELLEGEVHLFNLTADGIKGEE